MFGQSEIRSGGCDSSTLILDSKKQDHVHFYNDKAEITTSNTVKLLLSRSMSYSVF